eukprot:926523-Pelagomonas_calceolata.AAC.1
MAEAWWREGKAQLTLESSLTVHLTPHHILHGGGVFQCCGDGSSSWEAGPCPPPPLCKAHSSKADYSSSNPIKRTTPYLCTTFYGHDELVKMVREGSIANSALEEGLGLLAT